MKGAFIIEITNPDSECNCLSGVIYGNVLFSCSVVHNRKYALFKGGSNTISEYINQARPSDIEKEGNLSKNIDEQIG